MEDWFGVMVTVSTKVSARAYYILIEQEEEEVELGVKLGKRNETCWKHRDLVRLAVLLRDETAAETGVHSVLAVPSPISL